MRIFWFSAFVLFGAVHIASAAAGDAASRGALEGQIAALLSYKTVVLPSLEEGGELRTESLPLAAATSGRVLTETTAFFEGCVLVVRLAKLVVSTEETAWRQRDKRLDLSLVETAPQVVEVKPPDATTLGLVGGSVTYQWRAGVGQRMESLRRLANDILDDAIARFPSDVATRLTWISDRYDEGLVDKVYLNAGVRTYYVNGEEITGPLLESPRFSLEGEQATAFVELVHRWQLSYCSQQSSV